MLASHTAHLVVINQAILVTRTVAVVQHDDRRLRPSTAPVEETKSENEFMSSLGGKLNA